LCHGQPQSFFASVYAGRPAPRVGAKQPRVAPAPSNGATKIEFDRFYYYNMKPNTVYIVLNRIYDVLETAGLGVKNTLDRFKLESAFVNENGTLFSMEKDGVKTRITVGDHTLMPTVDCPSNVKWVPVGKTDGAVYYCINKERNETLKTFFATLAGQSIPRDKLYTISEIAVSLVVEYAEFPEYYAVRSILGRNATILALQTRIADVNAHAENTSASLSKYKALADDAVDRIAAANARADAADTRAEVANMYVEELEKRLQASEQRAEKAEKRAADMENYADLANKRATEAEVRARENELDELAYKDQVEALRARILFLEGTAAMLRTATKVNGVSSC